MDSTGEDNHELGALRDTERGEIMVAEKSRGAKFLKVASLIVLTLQNAVLALSMRHAKTQTKEDMFISSTAVVMAEITKLFISLILVYFYESLNRKHYFKLLNSTVVKQPIDTLKVGIPSLLYVIQNNLLYLAATHLDAGTYQITYQLKILTTAFFAVIILKRSLLTRQWSALLILITGVVMVQLAGVSDKTKTENQNRLVGMVAALCACFLSGLAGIYFEKILKDSDISVWMRNVQLSTMSIPVGLISALITDWSAIFEKGFFYGYNNFIIYLIALQAAGGLIVAVVVKYADNILKGFATSMAIIISCACSVYIFGLTLNYQFVAGAMLVIASVFLYSCSLKTLLFFYKS